MAKDTKERIIQKASILFQKKGYQDVGIREIAREAGCSHTTLYLYFKTKDDILFEVAHKPLQQLIDKIKEIENTKNTVENKIVEMCHMYIKFGFEHRNSYDLLFLYGAERVDEETFKNPINEIRITNFNLLKGNINQIFSHISDEEEKLNITRGLFLFLHGFIHLYGTGSVEYDIRLKNIVNDYLKHTILIRKPNTD